MYIIKKEQNFKSKKTGKDYKHTSFFCKKTGVFNMFTNKMNEAKVFDTRGGASNFISKHNLKKCKVIKGQ